MRREAGGGGDAQVLAVVCRQPPHVRPIRRVGLEGGNGGHGEKLSSGERVDGLVCGEGVGWVG